MQIEISGLLVAVYLITGVPPRERIRHRNRERAAVTSHELMKNIELPAMLTSNKAPCNLHFQSDDFLFMICSIDLNRGLEVVFK